MIKSDGVGKIWVLDLELRMNIRDDFETLLTGQAKNSRYDCELQEAVAG